MVSDFVITENHGRKQNPLPVVDPVALSWWPHDMHEARRLVRDGVVWHEGIVFDSSADGDWRPFGIPYRALVPRRSECVNLLTPTCPSSSYVAYGACRIEYQFMGMAQAVATAAAFSIDEKTAVQDVDYARLRRRLLQDGQILEVPPPTVGFDFSELAGTKKLAAHGNHDARKTVRDLIKGADEYLALAPEKVTDGDIPTTGNKHDFYAIGKYAWPNPDTPDGMPYIRIDCKINPEADGPRFDLRRYKDTIDRIRTLTRAWFYTSDEKYASKAAELIRVWFINEDTKMSPHFECAAALPGKYNGMAIGIIFGVRLIEVIDHARILSSTRSWMPADDAALKQWFRNYVDWLRTSEFGIKEREARNNHGTWYAAQVAAASLYTGEMEFAREMANFGKRQIDEQMAPDGGLPHELKRDWAFSYTVYAMRAFTTLAHCADHAGVDLWNYQTADGRGLRLAYEFLSTHLAGRKKWEWGIVREGENTELNAMIMLQRASLKYDSPLIREALEKLKPSHHPATVWSR
jgi:hypothetical protein